MSLIINNKKILILAIQDNIFTYAGTANDFLKKPHVGVNVEIKVGAAYYTKTDILYKQGTITRPVYGKIVEIQNDAISDQGKINVIKLDDGYWYPADAATVQFGK
ncbi:hypothetical protein LA2_07600 [Lactobacillus amylovorus GRL 1112]|uniref:Uncharacterized protein n=1 Tax=Lactobacillus amylovorus (strain GRL 1112) TaxID=695560 RepID=E4SKP2_LACAR|nr:hypothetical protein [Lactobacillus amylovorus]ADQ59439.1 hypothetical protein LA2_07600 [Lactobacillus amylovorus GRL 1112]